MSEPPSAVDPRYATLGSSLTHPSAVLLLGVGLLCNLYVAEATPMGRLNSKQELKDLSDELAALITQQSDTRLTEVFIRMTQEEVKAFNLRAERISQIYAILSDHDAKR